MALESDRRGRGLTNGPAFGAPIAHIHSLTPSHELRPHTILDNRSAESFFSISRNALPNWKRVSTNHSASLSLSLSPTPDMTNERGAGGSGGEGKASGDFNSLNTKEAFQMSHTVRGRREPSLNHFHLACTTPKNRMEIAFRGI